MDDTTPDTTRYIAFEGAEGAGKSSIARRVAAHLTETGSGEVVMVREPGGTVVGEAIREILLAGRHHPWPRGEAALFAAARAQLVAEVVVPALERGAWVLSDRSAYSSLAYQAGGRGIPIEEVRRLNDIAIAGIWPGRVVLLRIDPDTGLRRQAVDDRIGSESAAFHADVDETFDALAAAEPGRFVVVDASKPLATVVQDVIASIQDLMVER